MSLFDSIRYRLRVFMHSREHEQELKDEMDFFVRAEARQLEHASRGALTSEQALREARLRFGNTTYYGEEARRISGLGVLDTIVQDARFALRTFARTPAFTAIAVITLAIGIGANTAIFSAVDTLLLTPLPFHEPDRLMDVSLTVPATSANRAQDDIVWSYPKVEAFREGQEVFSDLTAWFATQSTLRIGDDALRLNGEFIDEHYFPTLGVSPALGRAMLPTENRLDTQPVVVLSDELWRTVFNADPDVIGRQVGIDLADVTIVGVAPPRFAGVSGQARFWVSFLSAPSVWDAMYFSDPYNHEFHVIGRLEDGITPERAAAAAQAVGPRVDALYPDPDPRVTRHWGVKARTLDDTRLNESDRQILFLLFGAVGIVLLVACANVASLLLVRASGRRREIGVRLAIGASRGRLVRQLLVETVLLTLAGGIASIAVAAVGVKIISIARPALWSTSSASGIGTVFVEPIRLSLTALAFTGVIAIATGVLFGLFPAIGSTRPDLVPALKTEAGTAMRTARGQRVSMRSALTAFEIALAVILLAASGVLVRTLIHLTAVRPGFEPNGVLTMRVNRAADWSRDSIARFYDVAVDRLREVPGVTHVAIADCSPQSGGCAGQEIEILDSDVAGKRDFAGLHWITPGWEDVLRVPLLRGRGIQSSDRMGTPRVALVSQGTARRFWPDEDALGKRLIVNGSDTVHVVGVVGDVRYFAIQDEPRPDVYISYHQFPMSFRMMLHLRMNGDPAITAESARRALSEVAPGFPMYDVATLETRIGGALGQPRFMAQLLSLFAVLALVLATIGTYGVISHAVAQRTREMGIRVALGATRASLIQLVLRQGLLLAVAGGALGLAGAYAAVRTIRMQLYGVQPADPVTLAGIVVVLTMAVLVACWVPARRAASVPAVQSLRGG